MPLALAQDDESEEVFELSPFTVDGSEEQGYRATSTLAGTRIRTDLKDVGSAISVITQEFLQDTNSNNSQDLLVYATSTEVAGQGGNFVGEGSGTFLDPTNRKEPVSNSRVRGLAEADNTRNYFLSDIPWDSYNVGRIELQRGPNSVLFGIGSPAGIVNAGLISAAFEDANDVGIQFGSFGSKRFTGNFNKVILEDELAIRLALLKDDTKYRQDPAFRDDERVFTAINWKPKFLAGESYNSEFAINYENGKIDSNNPRLTPPIDAITPWFDAMGKQTYRGDVIGSTATADWYLADGVTPNGYGGATQPSSPNYSPWLGAAGNRVFDGVINAFTPEGGQGASFIADVRTYPDPDGGTAGSGGGQYRGITTFNSFASNVNSNLSSGAFPGTDISAYKARSLVDPSIFDFYNHLLEGDNKSEFNDFDALNLTFRQNFLNNKLGYEIAYDKQGAEWGYSNFLNGDAAGVTVDVMSHLVDGTANPNVGRPMVIAGGGVDGYLEFRDREVKRATVYGELDFTDSSSETMAKFLGRHTFTGLYSENKIDNSTYEYKRNFIGGSFAPNAGAAVNQGQRDSILFSYLGDSIAGANTAAGLDIQPVSSIQNPVSSTIRVWNNTPVAGFDPSDPDLTQAELNDPANYLGWETLDLETVNAYASSFRDRPYTKATLLDNKIESEALVWQGYFFDGLVVPMIGWRNDKDTARSAGTPSAVSGIVDAFDPTFVLPSGPDDLGSHNGSYNSESGGSRTRSLVVHTPSAVRDSIGLDFSFHFNESANFQPDASRIDVLGNTVASPKGETEEYGFTIAALENKLVLKANWYETTVFNATAGNAITGNYLIGAVEAWGQQFAIEARDGTGSFGTVFGQSSSGEDVVYRPSGAADAEGNYTQAQLDAAYAIQDAAITAWLDNPITQQFQTTWALTDYETVGGQTNFGPPGLVTTSDTYSQGFEFEVAANPIAGLSLAFNAAKMEAQRANLASGYVDFVEARYDDFRNTPQGDIRLWGANEDQVNNGETVLGKYRRETIAGLNFWRALEDGNVPELVEWRYNAVANYSFQDGRFDGLNIGGSVRYQESPTVGFPVVEGANGSTYDVDNPIEGNTEETWDFWAGYAMALNDNIDWKIQLNIRNAFGGKDLYPVTVQPDGSLGTVRIGAPTTWTIKNTFSF